MQSNKFKTHTSDQIRYMARMLNLSILEHAVARLKNKSVLLCTGPTHTGKMYYWQSLQDPFANNAHTREEFIDDIKADIEFWKQATYNRIEAMTVAEIQAYLNKE